MILTTYLKSDDHNFFHTSNDILNKETIHIYIMMLLKYLIFNKFRNIAQYKQITLKTVYAFFIPSPTMISKY